MLKRVSIRRTVLYKVHIPPVEPRFCLSVLQRTLSLSFGLFDIAGVFQQYAFDQGVWTPVHFFYGPRVVS